MRRPSGASTWCIQMLYPAMYASASALAFDTACRAAPEGRSANRRVSRASAHCLRDHLLEVRLREVEQRHEGELRGEEILGKMGGHVDGGEELIHVHLRPQLQLAPAPQRPADLQHVPVDLLERLGEPLEERVELLRIRDEALLDEALQGRRIAVLR